MLRVDEQGLHLDSVPHGQSLHPDFLRGRLRGRIRAAGRELVVRAVLGRRKPPLRVLDATAGLATDAFVLASSGLQVTLLERSPLLHALLEDALERAAADPETAPVMARMTLHLAEAADWLREPANRGAQDVVYLDPMFPSARGRALPAGAMQLLQALAGEGSHEENRRLLQLARAATARVVLKGRLHRRPYNRPGHSLTGRSIRLDVYVQSSGAAAPHSSPRMSGSSRRSRDA